MEAEELTVRFAKEADIPRIVELLRQVNNVHQQLRPDLFLPDHTKYAAPEIKKMLRLHDTVILVTVDAQGLVLGYLFAFLKQIRGDNLVSRRSMHIDDLCVDAAVRHSGVGRRLLEQAVECAGQLGCADITLNVWEGNEDAISFYRNRGFAPKSHILEMKL